MRIPSPEALDEARVEVVLRELGFPVPVARVGWSAPVRAAAPTVQTRPHEPVPTFAVGEERVRHRGTGPVTAATLVCSCGSRSCVHVAAVLVCVAFDDPLRRSVFDGPAWALALAPLAGVKTPVAAASPGHLQVSLRPWSADLPGLGIELHWLVANHPTRPKPGQGTAEERALVEAVAALEQARRLRSPGLQRHLARSLVAALRTARDVRYGGAPVRVLPDDVRPRLVAEGRRDGDLALRFVPAVRARWPEGDVVLTADGALGLLADDVPEAWAQRLPLPLPGVPRAEVAAFVDQVIVDRGLPVVLPDWLDPVGTAEERRAAVALSEQGGALRVALSLTLARGGVRGVVDEQDPSPTLRIVGGGVVRRDPAWEREQRERFVADVGGDLRLEGDAAFDWLADVLPTLLGRWEVEGRDTLVEHRVKGTAAPRVRFTEGVDWFDLDVQLAVGEAWATGAESARRWLAGGRWVRLDDGSAARLPAEWLARHARALDSLAEVRRAQRGLGSWAAWTASELLAEVGGPAARWLAMVRARDAVARRPAPAGLTATLRPYQQAGFEWMCFLRDHGLHGLLADEMGLGKTLQALAFALDTGGPTLVVAPTSVLHAWCDEAARFAPGLRVVAWHGAGRGTLDADLVVTTYALLRRDLEVLAAREWATVVLDEAQYVKNPASQTARAARRLRARHRVALTGTPIENDLLELWSLFHFLMPGFLGRRSAFHARYQTSARDPDDRGTSDLAARIRPFVLRRRKQEVAAELPERTEQVLRVALSDRERRLYEQVRTTVRAAASAPDDERAVRRTAVILEGLTRLRQACCHPALLPMPEARAVTRSAKLEALLDDLDVSVPAGERTLVFSQWVRLLDEVAHALAARGIRASRLDGSTQDRAGVVAEFQGPSGPPVMLISIKAGGTGLTLTAADRVILLDPWWNPAVEEQAAARAHRIGRTRPVTVVRIVARDTVEDKVLALQDNKRRLAAEAIDGPALDVSALRTEDLLALLALA